jgi:hypothetical protein
VYMAGIETARKPHIHPSGLDLHANDSYRNEVYKNISVFTLNS